MTVSCRKKTYSGEVNISGYIFQNCNLESADFDQLSYQQIGAFLYTTIDTSNGYFQFSGNYTYDAFKGSDIHRGNIFLEKGAINEPGTPRMQLIQGVQNMYSLDTIYVEHWAYGVLTIDLGASSTNTDRIDMTINSYTDSATKNVYIGPFSDNEVLDTFKIAISPHVGFPLYNYPRVSYRFNNLNGQSAINEFASEAKNIKCGEFVNVIIKI